MELTHPDVLSGRILLRLGDLDRSRPRLDRRPGLVTHQCALRRRGL
jgi:hypothetical protein